MLLKLKTAPVASWSSAVTFYICLQAMLLTGCDQGKSYSYDSSKANNVKGGLINPYTSADSSQPGSATQKPLVAGTGSDAPTPIPNTGAVGGSSEGTSSEGEYTEAPGEAALDGLALYNSTCLGCHGADGGAIRDKTATGTANAIRSTPAMAKVKLSEEELEAIAKAIE